MEFIVNNWQWLLAATVGVAEIVVNITPTKKDNSILNSVVKVIDALIPNNKKGGGKFKLKSVEE